MLQIYSDTNDGLCDLIAPAEEETWSELEYFKKRETLKYFVVTGYHPTDNKMHKFNLFFVCS